MKTQKYIPLVLALVMVGGIAVAFPAFAQNAKQPNDGPAARARVGAGRIPGVTGTVSAINGNLITITGRAAVGQTTVNPVTTTATYIVDATNAKISKNNVAGTITSIAVGDTIMAQGKITGTNVSATIIRDVVMTPGARAGTGVVGSVSAISGTTITLASKNPKGGTSTVYAVDASGATIMKNGQTAVVSAISVGDIIVVQGTISGANVVAKTIRDGAGQPQPAIQGNGQPVVAGKISTINGNTITITNASNVTYTIDATSAKFVINGTANPTISNVLVGDNIVVQGTVNGTSVTASSIIDQKARANNGDNNSGKSAKPQTGVMGGIANFFKHLFGF